MTVDPPRSLAPPPAAAGPSGIAPPSLETGAILEPGRTCWRIERTNRLSVIVDAEAYFLHAKAALRRARRDYRNE